ncbi:hypothetical protein LJ656_17835 [Paraburkholderia sp. MMS20-SJTR3]|uniref:Six-cysteine peptide SCIFF n=1 Tax=Paraburkholderia sejongensis TaxID=2886946 RepID=A0ABS8JX27_9BURK|nr:hypothetical protein [Paraburkholderia sp. MMS20-SJTR3]MCC8394460.1 hypothetical protein [Paraburkholderia sp. MMS20-SJTR3]
MQQIDRNELAKANVAGGCCKTSCDITTSCSTDTSSTGGTGGNPLPVTSA